jgi:hydroxypyruvate isomerase
MTENEKIELFDKWYDENYDEWAEGEEGIALREELEQAFKSGIAELEKENAELKAEIENDRDLPAIAYMQGAEKQKRKDEEQLTKAKEILKAVVDFYPTTTATIFCEAEQFLSEVEK